jgi:hypothetical protein
MPACDEPACDEPACDEPTDGVNGLETREASENEARRGRVTDRASSLSEDLELAHRVHTAWRIARRGWGWAGR